MPKWCIIIIMDYVWTFYNLTDSDIFAPLVVNICGHGFWRITCNNRFQKQRAKCQQDKWVFSSPCPPPLYSSSKYGPAFLLGHAIAYQLFPFLFFQYKVKMHDVIFIINFWNVIKPHVSHFHIQNQPTHPYWRAN